MKIDLNEIHEENNRFNSLHKMLGHSDNSKLNLNQGCFKNHWYFGKSIEINERPVDGIVFDDGRVYLNYKQSVSPRDKEFGEMENEIKGLGFDYSDSLVPMKNTFSQQGLKDFIESIQNSNEISDISEVEGEMTSISGSTCLKMPLRAYLLIHNIHNNVSTLTYTKTSLTSLTSLLISLKNIQEYFMDVSDKRLFTLTSLFIINTYCFELYNSLGYLFFCSDSGSGKTKYADIIRFLSFNSINATNPSESVLFRIIQQTKGTLFVDDYEGIDDKKKGAIDQILKVGYKRGGQTIRSEKVGDTYIPKFFDVYSPKVITNTIGLDAITYSRCIPVHLLKTATTKGSLNPSEFDDIWQTMRDECYKFVMYHWKDIKQQYDNIEITNFNNRDLELVKPILALAKLFGEDTYNEVNEYLTKIFSERDMFDFADDWDFILFNSIREYFGDLTAMKGEWMSAKEILELMQKYLNIEEGNAKPTARWIGKVLSRIDLIEKRRLSTGVEYRFETNLLDKYMKARGWYKDTKGDEK